MGRFGYGSSLVGCHEKDAWVLVRDDDLDPNLGGLVRLNPVGQDGLDELEAASGMALDLPGTGGGAIESRAVLEEKLRSLTEKGLESYLNATPRVERKKRNG
jgi:hypothetical protein